jgi:uncharacterized protein (DUF2147 family)
MQVTRLALFLTRFVVLALCASCALAAAVEDRSSPVGLWRSLDDKTGHVRGLIRIALERGKYVGRIEWTDNPEDQTNLCTHCPGDRKDTPIIGLAIIRDVERVGDAYGNGEILDPRNGATYGCTLRLEDDGRVLVVRGFLGIPLLGGSRRWYRAS